MKKRKAVVLYGSLTGNTEMVGKAMAEVLEEYGFETRCERLTAGKKWDDDPVYFDEYDIVVLGSLEEFTGNPARTAVIEKYMNIEDDYTMLGKNDPLGIGKPGSTFWHYDMAKRPSQRDLTKAKIFMAEIIEDYFLTTTGDPRPPYAMYTCIS